MPNIGDTKQFPNGRQGRWDGKGWEDITATPPRADGQQFEDLLTDVDSRQSLWRQITGYLTAGQRAETAAVNAVTAASMASIEVSKHTVLRFETETAAVNQANEAAGAAGVHPNVWHSQEYQMGKLNLTIAHETKVFEVLLEDWKQRLEYEVNLRAARDLDSRASFKAADLLERIQKLRVELEATKQSAAPEDVKRDQLRAMRKTIKILEAELDALLGRVK